MRISRTLLCALGVLTFAAPADAQILFAARGAGAGGELYTLNPATGAQLTDIGPLTDGTTNYGTTGIAFHPTTGVLYGSVDGKGVPESIRINPLTAQVTVIGLFNVGPSTTMRTSPSTRLAIYLASARPAGPTSTRSILAQAPPR